jgi:hypothetical protein
MALQDQLQPQSMSLQLRGAAVTARKTKLEPPHAMAVAHFVLRECTLLM